MPVIYNLLISILYVITAIFSAIFFVGVVVLIIGAFDNSLNKILLKNKMMQLKYLVVKK